MIATQQPSIQSPKFIDINTISHRFPATLKGLNIPATLLHNHSHYPTDHVLVYQNDFSEAIYKTKK